MVEPPPAVVLAPPCRRSGPARPCSPGACGSSRRAGRGSIARGSRARSWRLRSPCGERSRTNPNRSRCGGEARAGHEISHPGTGPALAEWPGASATFSDGRRRSRMKLRFAVFSAGLALGVRLAPRPVAPGAGHGAAATGPLARATFAGGCFWCMEAPFDKVAGGRLDDLRLRRREGEEPDLRAGLGGLDRARRGRPGGLRPGEGELRAPRRGLLAQRGPDRPGGQFCDRGSQYRTGIFYEGEAQKRAAEASKRALEASGRLQKPIVTEIVPARRVLPGGGLPPGLLQEEPGPLHDVPRGLRPGPAPRGAVGQGGRQGPGGGASARTARGLSPKVGMASGGTPGKDGRP